LFAESNAPAITNPSSARLLTVLVSTLRQKSKMLVKFLPILFLDFIISSTAPLPTFLIAERPKRILPSIASKLTDGLLTSGGRISIFSLRQSSRNFVTLTEFSNSLVRLAARNSGV